MTLSTTDAFALLGPPTREQIERLQNEIPLSDIDVTHHFGGGVYAKETHIAAGQVLVQHRHAHAHLSILASGTALVSQGGGCAQITGPKVITIVANELHRVEAITDCVWFCIHATTEIDPAKVDETLIVPSAKEEMLRFAEKGGR